MRLLALAASVAGVGVAIYLTAVHYAGVPLACPTAAAVNCEAVLSSPYGVVAGTPVPTSAAGILWFAISAFLWWRPRGRLPLLWAAIGMATVLYLVFIEIVQLGTVCIWCTVAHFLVLCIFLVAIMWTQPQQEAGGTA